MIARTAASTSAAASRLTSRKAENARQNRRFGCRGAAAWRGSCRDRPGLTGQWVMRRAPSTLGARRHAKGSAARRSLVANGRATATSSAWPRTFSASPRISSACLRLHPFVVHVPATSCDASSCAARSCRARGNAARGRALDRPFHAGGGRAEMDAFAADPVVSLGGVS